MLNLVVRRPGTRAKAEVEPSAVTWIVDADKDEWSDHGRVAPESDCPSCGRQHSVSADDW